MNEYSFEIKKKYGGEHPSYSGILTCNGSEYSMMLSADEEKEFSATIRDTAEMQKAYSQQDSLYVHIYPGEIADSYGGEYRYETRCFKEDAGFIMDAAKAAVQEFERNLAIDEALGIGKPGPVHAQDEPER